MPLMYNIPDFIMLAFGTIEERISESLPGGLDLIRQLKMTKRTCPFFQRYSSRMNKAPMRGADCNSWGSQSRLADKYSCAWQACSTP